MTKDVSPPSREDRSRPDAWPAGLHARATLVWRDWVRPLLIVVLVLGSLRSAVADWNDVPSGSMRPTILEGDRIFVNKLAYDLKVPFTTVHLAEWGDPERGDIVVLWSPFDGKRLVKRVVGVPGDSVAVRLGRLLVNGEPATYVPLGPDQRALLGIVGSAEPAFRETVFGRDRAVMGAASEPVADFAPVRVPADGYFVMGDHRSNSVDSRAWGFVSRDRIVGRAAAVVASLDVTDGYRPRWRRFFTALR